MFHFWEEFVQIMFITFVTLHLALLMNTGHLKSILLGSKSTVTMIFESTHQLHHVVHYSHVVNHDQHLILEGNPKDLR